MADTLQFTKQDFIELGIDQALVNYIYEQVPVQSSIIDRIVIIGKQLESLIRQYVEIRTLKTNRYGSFGDIKVGNSDAYVKQFMQMGAAYIFEVRHFLLDDEIEFSIGGLYSDKEGGTVALAEKRLSQREMLQSIRASLSSKAIVLEGSLERFASIDVERNGLLVQMWNQILEAADVSDFTYTKGITTRCLLPGKKTRFYQNPNADQQVWLRFVGKSHRIMTYYLKNGEANFFNKGWLYEWFRAYVITEEHINNLQNSLAHGSIEPIMGKIDNVAGYKGGDYSLGDKAGSVQAKYGNDQIISFTSILRVIFEINEILTLYKTKNPQDLETMAKRLFNLFTDPSTEQSLSLGVDQTIERILQIIKTK